MAVEIIVVVIGVAAVVVGVVGCVLPIVPGPVLAFAPLPLLLVVGGAEAISPVLVAVMAVVSLGATLTDQVLPITASRKAGAGRPGVLGSILGMLVGIVFFPPFGLIIGAFLGALLGELLFHRDNEHPLRAALGVLRGTLLAALVKLTVSGISAFFFARAAFRMLWG